MRHKKHKPVTSPLHRRHKRHARRLNNSPELGITWAQAAGLSTNDLNGVAEHAERLRRQGDISQAAKLYQLLTSFDPFERRWWEKAAALQRRAGELVAALSNYTMLEALAEIDDETRAQGDACLAELETRLAAIQ